MDTIPLLPPLQVSQIQLSQFLLAAPLLRVQTWAPKVNLFIPVREGHDDHAPQAASWISSHLAPHYRCQGGDERFWTANENSADSRPLHRISYLIKTLLETAETEALLQYCHPLPS